MMIHNTNYNDNVDRSVDFSTERKIKYHKAWFIILDITTNSHKSINHLHFKDSMKREEEGVVLMVCRQPEIIEEDKNSTETKNNHYI